MPTTKKKTQQPDYEVSDAYTELVSQACVTERIDPELRKIGYKGRQLSGKIECIRDQWPKCFLTLEWPQDAGAPDAKRNYASLEESPIEMLDALGALIPALVAQARRDGIFDHKR